MTKTERRWYPLNRALVWQPGVLGSNLGSAVNLLCNMELVTSPSVFVSFPILSLSCLLRLLALWGQDILSPYMCSTLYTDTLISVGYSRHHLNTNNNNAGYFKWYQVYVPLLKCAIRLYIHM